MPHSTSTPSPKKNNSRVHFETHKAVFDDNMESDRENLNPRGGGDRNGVNQVQNITPEKGMSLYKRKLELTQAPSSKKVAFPIVRSKIDPAEGGNINLLLCFRTWVIIINGVLISLQNAWRD